MFVSRRYHSATPHWFSTPWSEKMPKHFREWNLDRFSGGLNDLIICRQKCKSVITTSKDFLTSILGSFWVHFGPILGPFTLVFLINVYTRLFILEFHVTIHALIRNIHVYLILEKSGQKRKKILLKHEKNISFQFELIFRCFIDI